MALKSDLFDLLLQNVVPMGTVTAVEAATETSRATARTVWLTGLLGRQDHHRPGLAARLRDAGRRAEVLDGDAAREVLTAGLGFSRRDRDENVRRIGYVADLLSRSGVDAVLLGDQPVPWRPGRSPRPPAAASSRSGSPHRSTCALGAT